MSNGKRPPQKNWPQEKKPETSEESLRKIIENGDVEELNQQANDWGLYFAQGGERDRLSSSQIRNVLDRLQRMRTFDFQKLQLLRPLLAYAAGRHRGKVMDLQKVSDRAICMVKNSQQFVNFRNFFEAIVAYHRYHGGK
jgi:CRISPR-associated protein Csm2